MSAVLTATASDRNAANPTENETDPVESLKRRIERVAAVAGQIESLARRANMLALNSTIEAARAGGINKDSASIVADIKALAHRTGAVSDEIAQVAEGLICDFERLEAEREAELAQATLPKNSAPVLSIVRTPDPEPESETGTRASGQRSAEGARPGNFLAAQACRRAGRPFVLRQAVSDRAAGARHLPR